MDWKDTVMSEEAVRLWDEELPNLFLYSVIDPCFELETYGLRVAQAQAETSFKAGIREVVEFVSEYALVRNYPDSRLDIGDIVVYKAFWQAKLKEWGIE